MRTGQPTYDRDATEVIGLGDHPHEVRPRRHVAPKTRLTRRAKVLIACLVPLVLLGAGFASAGIYLNNVENKVHRLDAFDDVPTANRPQKDAAAKEAMNFLLLGSDTRNPESEGDSRTDTIIVLHIKADRSAAQLISIPRDTWTFIPKAQNGRNGGTEAKINAAFAWGGVPLMVQTVENYTGVRIDHVAIIDFSGFKEVVDALGGIPINVERSFTSHYSLNANHIRHFDKGLQTMNGAAALDYARERHAFKDGDFARIRHQQDVIKAILDKATSGGILSSPAKLNAFINATTKTVTVDKGLNLFTMATELRQLRSGNLQFLTSPTKGTGRKGDQSVVLPDPVRAKKLFTAVRADDTATIAQLAN